MEEVRVPIYFKRDETNPRVIQMLPEKDIRSQVPPIEIGEELFKCYLNELPDGVEIKAEIVFEMED